MRCLILRSYSLHNDVRISTIQWENQLRHNDKDLKGVIRIPRERLGTYIQKVQDVDPENVSD